MAVLRRLLWSFLWFGLCFGGVSCSSGEKVQDNTSPAVSKGEWSQLLLQKGTASRLGAVAELLQSRGLSFDSLRQERGSKLEYDPYFHTLKYPSTAQEVFTQKFGQWIQDSSTIKTKIPAGVWGDLERLYQSLWLVELYIQAFLATVPVDFSSSPWKPYELTLRTVAAFLEHLRSDPYIRYLLPHLEKILQWAEKQLGASDGDWRTSRRHLLAHQIRRLRELLREKSLSLDTEVQTLSDLTQQVRKQIHWYRPLWRVRTLHTHRSPRIRLVDGLRRYESILHLEVHPSGTLFFSDGSKIYLLTREGAQPVWELPTKNGVGVFHFDRFGRLYFLDPPYLRVLHLRSKLVENYPLGRVFLRKRYEPVLGRLVFCLGERGDVFLLHPGERAVFRLRLNPKFHTLEPRGKFPYRGDFTSLAYQKGSLFASDYRQHQLFRLDLQKKQWVPVGGRKGVPGHVDGPEKQSLLHAPLEVAPHPEGILVIEEGSHSIRLWRRGRLYTFVGLLRGNQDGKAEQARLDLPSSGGLGAKGELYFAEQSSSSIRVVAPSRWYYAPTVPDTFSDERELLSRAEYSWKRGQIREALNQLRKIIRRAPFGLTLYKALLLRAQVFLKKGILDPALEDCAKAIQLIPNNGAGYFHRAQVWLRKGNLLEAEKDWQKVLQLYTHLPLRKKCQNPFYLKTHWMLLESAWKQKQWDAFFQRANRFYSFLSSASAALDLPLKDWQKKVLHLRAKAYEIQGMRAKALEDYRRLAQLFPSSPEYLYHQAKILIQTGKFAEAHSLIQKLRRHYPQYFAVYKLLGDYYDRRGEEKKALPYYQTFLDLGGESPQVVERIRQIVEKHRQGKEYVDVLVRRDGKTYRIRYYPDGRTEVLEVPGD